MYFVRVWRGGRGITQIFEEIANFYCILKYLINMFIWKKIVFFRFLWGTRVFSRFSKSPRIWSFEGLKNFEFFVFLQKKYKSKIKNKK